MNGQSQIFIANHDDLFSITIPNTSMVEVVCTIFTTPLLFPRAIKNTSPLAIQVITVYPEKAGSVKTVACLSYRRRAEVNVVNHGQPCIQEVLLRGSPRNQNGLIP